APLTPAHGFPLRLIVPGWYAVASVKWLTEIEVIDHTFEAHYQTDKYWYEWTRGGGVVREPVTRMRVRSLITEPVADAQVSRGLVGGRTHRPGGSECGRRSVAGSALAERAGALRILWLGRARDDARERRVTRAGHRRRRQHAARAGRMESPGLRK